MGTLLSLLTCLAELLNTELPAGRLDPAWESSIGERMAAVPNPYENHPAIRFETPVRGKDPWIPQLGLRRERRYFEMEDSADWMGVKLGRGLTAGLQVEFVGPAEDPKRERKMTNLKDDPFVPSYVQTTAGIRIRF